MQSQKTAAFWNNLKKNYAKQQLSMLESGQLTLNNRTMKFHYFIKGPKPADGYPLIFGFHGGGGCPANVNDSQYNNHKALYKKQLPNSCIWLAPRSIEDVWDMWWKDYLEDFILEIVRSFVINELVNVNKVFITGYSAGGDGVYHMASRLADHLAGAAMMAGHPNSANFTNLRNLKFSIQVGALDKAYNRANEGIKCSRMMAQLAQNYGGYQNKCNVMQNKGHWMDKEDSKVFNWLFSAIRNPYPQTILFKQCTRRKKAFFYYLRIGESLNSREDEDTLVIKEGNTFRIFSNRKLSVFVNSNMVNPYQPISIIHNGQKTAERLMVSNLEIIEKTTYERVDPYFIFQDELVSSPSRMIDIEAAICYEFCISLAEKNAEYEPGLSKKPEQTPSNFSRSLNPLMKRSNNLPQRFLTGYKESEVKEKDTENLDQWGNQLNQQWNYQHAPNSSPQGQSQEMWNYQQRQGDQLDVSYQQMNHNQSSSHYQPPYLHSRNNQQNTQQIPYNPYNQYAPKQNRGKGSDCKIF